LIKKHMPQEALSYGAENLVYKYKQREKSFNYQRFDLADYPEALTEAMRLANLY